MWMIVVVIVVLLIGGLWAFLIERGGSWMD